MTNSPKREVERSRELSGEWVEKSEATGHV